MSIIQSLGYWCLDRVLPQLTVSRLAGYGADAKAGPLTQACIRWFIRRYGVDMQEALHPDPAHYDSFNAFFTRPLKPGSRRLTGSAQELLCPVDGTISQLGPIAHGEVIQAKGHHYQLLDLLGGDQEACVQYQDGQFATLYLSPKDYHRVHMPAAGRLQRMLYVPGRLFSVNEASVRRVSGLFARNERLICHFEGPQGPFVQILVGATIVGSMETVWSGVVCPPRQKRIQQWDYRDQAIQLGQGDEMGRFRLGSTSILLFPKGSMRFDPEFSQKTRIRLGESLGHWL